ncbi:MAG: ArsR/SmtB family transcription factor [Candidatus Thorarchaeota archaeon]
MADKKVLERCVQFHKALSNPVRLRIVEELLQRELCQCEIFPKIGLAQSTLSSYLSQLVRVGILAERRDGQRKLYRIANERIANLLELTKKTLQEVIEGTS